MELTQQEILQDALIAEKYIMHMYCQFGLECSNQSLRDLFSELHSVASKHDLKLFKVMNEKGFYPKTEAPVKDVKQAIKMHTEMQTKLENKVIKK
ncbi:MAG: spore coat protein [Clostridiales bacterium]|nr:spore coat protein [Clostridiales bacterium]